MANIFTNEKVNDKTILMSNGSTSVFLETLCLAGADIAIENYQKDLMIWFAQHDWTIRGMGAEGFDICDIIWDKQLFEQQKRFINQVIDLTQNKTNWNLLPYTPDEERLLMNLSEFREMINDFNIGHIDLEQEEKLIDFDDKVQLYEQCSKHRAFKHWHGCIICNNDADDINEQHSTTSLSSNRKKTWFRTFVSQIICRFDRK
jgi:hypothetical protein